MMQKRPRCVVFDIGGVLLDIDWRRVVQALGVEAEEKYLRWVQTWPLHHQYEKGLQTTEGFLTQLRDYWKLDYSLKQLDDAWNAIFVGQLKDIDKVIVAMPSDLPRYILSNTNESHIRFCWNRYPVLKEFQTPFFSYDMQMRKPEPEIYESIAKTIGLPPGEILFLDDGKENVESARRVGLMAEQTIHSAQTTLDILKRYQVIAPDVSL